MILGPLSVVKLYSLFGNALLQGFEKALIGNQT